MCLRDILHLAQVGNDMKEEVCVVLGLVDFKTTFVENIINEQPQQ